MSEKWCIASLIPRASLRQDQERGLFVTNLSVARQHACVWMHHKVPHMHFLMEQGRTLPQRRLQELVYEQWLHADLRDVVVQPCVPLYATQQQTCQITGQYIVQVYFNMVVCFNSTSTLHCRLYTYWILIRHYIAATNTFHWVQAYCWKFIIELHKKYTSHLTGFINFTIW